MTTVPAANPLAPNPKAVLGALGALAVATITILTTFTIVDWTAAQTALVTAEVGAVLALLTARAAHVKRGTQQEYVALAATFTATISATLALGSGFEWWTPTDAQASALVGIVTAVVGVGTAMLARDRVQADLSPADK